MNSPLRLLISARDPGAANHLLPVIQYLARHPAFAVRALAAPPADQTFSLAGLDFEPVTERGDTLRERLRRLLARHRPEAILTGLSGPDSGLDEVLLAESTPIPSFAYQDFWGDVNLSEGRAADCYLVRDDYAARLSEQRFGVHTLVVGAPVAATAPGSRLPRQRRSRRIDTVGWCGQPLWDVDGYAQTFRTFARQFRHARILVKTHPKEDRGQGLRYRCLAGGHKLELWRGSLQGLFERCGLVASAFSNCALEQAAFNARLHSGFSVPVQLLFDRRLRATYRSWSGTDRLPLVEQGLALGVGSRGLLAKQLSASRLQDAARRSSWRARGLPSSSQVPQRVAEAILDRVHPPKAPVLRRA